MSVIAGGWIIAWFVGWIFAFALVDPRYSDDYLVVGAMAGAICGAVGSGVMYWQFSRARRNS